MRHKNAGTKLIKYFILRKNAINSIFFSFVPNVTFYFVPQVNDMEKRSMGITYKLLVVILKTHVSLPSYKERLWIHAKTFFRGPNSIVSKN